MDPYALKIPQRPAAHNHNRIPQRDLQPDEVLKVNIIDFEMRIKDRERWIKDCQKNINKYTDEIEIDNQGIKVLERALITLRSIE